MSIEIQGSKNATTPILVSTLLCKKKCIIYNSPNCRDIDYIIKIIRTLGHTVIQNSESIEIIPNKVNPENFRNLDTSKSRSSLYFYALYNKKPIVVGGCQIGDRNLDTYNEVFHQIKKNKKKIFFPEMSVTVTNSVLINLSQNCVKFTLIGVSSEPCVQNLCYFLRNIGVSITGIGTNILKIKGNNSLGNTITKFRVMSDPIEAFTWMVMAARHHSNVKIKKVPTKYMYSELYLLKRLGYRFKINTNTVTFLWPTKLKTVSKIHNMPYPGLSPDILPLLPSLLLNHPGKTLIHDWMYNKRCNHIEPLINLGANIAKIDDHQYEISKSHISSGVLKCNDIRSGMNNLIISTLYDGITITNTKQIERGYSSIREKLSKFGCQYQKEHYHLIGISGCGMISLAEILIELGYTVTGSDYNKNNLNIQLDLDQSGKYINQNTIIIKSSAIPDTHQELLKANKLGCLIYHRTEILSRLLDNYYMIGVVGAHGKTTTTTLIKYLLGKKYDIGWVIGSKLEGEQSGHLGIDKIVVIELDESDGSFLNFKPNIGVITNIDTDHLDYYENMDNMIKSYEKFTHHCCQCVITGDPRIKKCKNKDNILVDTNNLQIKLEINKTRFHYNNNDYSLPVIGKYNVKNAIYALEVFRYLEGCYPNNTFDSYQLPKHRLEFLYNDKDTIVIKDYAHHPTEIKELINSMSVFNKPVIGYYVPHRISRIMNCYQEFKDIGNLFSQMYILPIDVAHENSKLSLNIEEFSRHFNGVYLQEFPKIKKNFVNLFIGVNIKIDIKNLL